MLAGILISGDGRLAVFWAPAGSAHGAPWNLSPPVQLLPLAGNTASAGDTSSSSSSSSSSRSIACTDVTPSLDGGLAVALVTRAGGVLVARVGGDPTSGLAGSGWAPSYPSPGGATLPVRAHAAAARFMPGSGGEVLLVVSRAAPGGGGGVGAVRWAKVEGGGWEPGPVWLCPSAPPSPPPAPPGLLDLTPDVALLRDEAGCVWAVRMDGGGGGAAPTRLGHAAGAALSPNAFAAALLAPPSAATPTTILSLGRTAQGAGAAPMITLLVAAAASGRSLWDWRAVPTCERALLLEEAGRGARAHQPALTTRAVLALCDAAAGEAGEAALMALAADTLTAATVAALLPTPTNPPVPPPVPWLAWAEGVALALLGTAAAWATTAPAPGYTPTPFPTTRGVRLLADTRFLARLSRLCAALPGAAGPDLDAAAASGGTSAAALGGRASASPAVRGPALASILEGALLFPQEKKKGRGGTAATTTTPLDRAAVGAALTAATFAVKPGHRAQAVAPHSLGQILAAASAEGRSGGTGAAAVPWPPGPVSVARLGAPRVDSAGGPARQARGLALPPWPDCEAAASVAEAGVGWDRGRGGGGALSPGAAVLPLDALTGRARFGEEVSWGSTDGTSVATGWAVGELLSSPWSVAAPGRGGRWVRLLR